MFTKPTLVAVVALVASLAANSSFAFDDFNGVIEKRPATSEGEWLIGGRKIYTTGKTKLDDSDGPLEVGACVEVDISQGWVTEIERDADWRCRD